MPAPKLLTLSPRAGSRNGNAWTGLQSILGGETSGPIMQTTQYTLTCLDLAGTTLTQTATATILPTFQEQ